MVSTASMSAGETLFHHADEAETVTESAGDAYVITDSCTVLGSGVVEVDAGESNAGDAPGQPHRLGSTSLPRDDSESFRSTGAVPSLC